MDALELLLPSGQLSGVWICRRCGATPWSSGSDGPPVSRRALAEQCCASPAGADGRWPREVDPAPPPELPAGAGPPFTAPWRVESWENDHRKVVYSVWSGDRKIVVQPGEQSEAWCRAVVRSRNEGTAAEDIAYLEERHRRGIEDARAEVDRVRAHFQAQVSSLLDANARLQDAIVAARASGSVADLPAWCRPSDAHEQAMAAPATKTARPVGGKRPRKAM